MEEMVEVMVVEFNGGVTVGGDSGSGGGVGGDECVGVGGDGCSGNGESDGGGVG